MIIGLSGKKRSGKDEFYRVAKAYLESSKGIPVERYAFADKVKEYARTYFGVKDTDDKEKIRFVFQGIGQMMRETCNKTYWIDIIEQEVRASEAKYGKGNFFGIITDVRYLNEAEWLENNGYRLLRVLRPGVDLSDPHPSETEIDVLSFREIIHNHGTQEDYKREVIQWLTEHL